MKNIFLHFFNPDLRQFLGFYNLPRAKHVCFLSQALNISIFFTRDFVILPPTFLECELTLKVLQKYQFYFDCGLIRLPLRENFFDTFIEKKIKEYEPIISHYPMFLANKIKTTLNFLIKISSCKIERSCEVGNKIAERWLSGPDSNVYWRELTGDIKNVDLLIQIPNRLRQDGLAVLSGNIQSRVPLSQNISTDIINRLLYHDYASIYTDEYDAEIISDLPYFGYSCGLKYNITYNYRSLKKVLDILGIFDIIINLDPLLMKILRGTLGYRTFMHNFQKISRIANNFRNIEDHYIIASTFKNIKSYRSYLNNYTSIPNDVLIDIVDNILFEVSHFEDLLKVDEISKHHNENHSAIFSEEVHMAQKSHLALKLKNVKLDRIVVIFVNDIERDEVLRAIKEATGNPIIDSPVGELTCWDCGVLRRAKIIAIESAMGSSGISGSTLTTVDTIDIIKPDYIFAIGIAFGVDAKKQRIGNILISRKITPYEQQRIGQDKEGKPVIRPRGTPEEIKPIIRSRVRMAQRTFDTETFFAEMLSGEKLIDNIDYRKDLISYFPEAEGGEMEGSGIVSASERRGVPWVIIKAISDFADGKKRRNKVLRQKKAASEAARFFIHLIS